MPIPKPAAACALLALGVAGFAADGGSAALEALLAAALAAQFALPEFKSAADKTRVLAEISLHGPFPEEAIARAVASAQGNNLARYLTALPPNELTPATYRKRAEQLAKEYGIPP